MYYIFAFRSRTGAMHFYELLKKEGVSAALINTPKAAGIGCGLSVRVSDYEAGRRALSIGFSSFHSVFRCENVNGYLKIERF